MTEKNQDLIAVTMGYDAELSYTPSDAGMSRWHLTPSNAYSTNTTTVWNDYRGDGIRVGILDEGVDFRHADLATNYDASLDYDFEDGDSGAFPGAGQNHGTAVAGVIAADDNGTGAVGVAPDATITGYKMGFGGGITLNTIGQIYETAADNVDILNNSWSFTGYFSDNIHTEAFDPVFDGLQDLAQTGRGGLGTVTVFSAGNSRIEGDDVNTHGQQNSPYTISVGAIDSDGGFSSFSTPGAAVLLSAGGRDIYTTDITGSDGYSTGDYTTISGTSFSAPIVSGVAALMLDSNEDLGYRDVQEILALSSWNSDTSFADWQDNGAGNWNGGGMHYSHQYGFGIVDAHAAVRLAETWTEQSTFSNIQRVSVRDTSYDAITDFGTVTKTVNVTQDINIEHVLIDLNNVSHTAVGDLRITLTSPDGTVSVLMDHVGGAIGSTSGSIANYTGTQLTSVAHWGESTQGTWTLEIQDAAALDEGYLSDWSLSFIGSTPDVNDTYFYTKEFSDYYDGTRNTLNDTNGGVDTINAASLTTNSSMYLNAGAYSVIDGRNLDIVDDTIENAYGGDGDDLIRGNSLDNALYGMRGNDRLSGGDGGTNMLDGGQGVDTAEFFYAVSDYVISFVSTVEIVLESAFDGIHQLFNFEYFDFNGDVYDYDGLYAFSSASEITGDGNDNILDGTAGDDTINGLAGNDTLTGGAGSDILKGGTGDDSYYIDALDTIVEGVNEGFDTVFTGATQYRADANIEAVKILGTTRVIADGNDGAELLVSNNSDHILRGFGGQDVLVSTGGNDRLVGGDGFDHAVIQGDYSDFNISITRQGHYNVKNTDTGDVFDIRSTEAIKFTDGMYDVGARRFTATDFENVDSVTDLTNIAQDVINLDLYNAYAIDLNRVARFEGDIGDVINFNDVLVLSYDDPITLSGVDYTHYSYGLTDILISENISINPVDAGAVVFNNAPVTQDDVFTVAEDTLLSGDILADNGNGVDSDPDGDALSVIAGAFLSQAGGTVIMQANGNYDYTPPEDFFGLDSFTYTAVDANGAETLGYVSVDVTPENDNPDAVDDGFSAVVNEVYEGNLLANDSDVDGDIITVVAASFATATGATVVIDTNGDFIYTPFDGYTGADSFTYTVRDPSGLTDTATATIEVAEGEIRGDDTNNTLNGTNGDDVIYGLAGDDILNGLEGDDILIGGAGSDILSGGAGNDSYYADALDMIVEGVNEGFDTVFTGATQYRADANIEAVKILGTTRVIADGNDGAELLVSNNSDHILRGFGGQDVLVSTGGNDRLVGGDGVDRAVIQGNFDDFNITAHSRGYHVTNTITGDTVDLRSTEAIKFTDGYYNVARSRFNPTEFDDADSMTNFENGVVEDNVIDIHDILYFHANDLHVVNGDAGDTVTLDTDLMIQNADQVSHNGQTYTHYNYGVTDVLIDVDITVMPDNFI